MGSMRWAQLRIIMRTHPQGDDSDGAKAHEYINEQLKESQERPKNFLIILGVLPISL